MAIRFIKGDGGRGTGDGRIGLPPTANRQPPTPYRLPPAVVRLHSDESGTISIISVFTVMLLVMLLGMVLNTGRQVDGKIRLQNGADAATYSGGVVLARGMNTLAFTNHLLCDVFAVTAFMREARDRNSESYAPGILAAWKKVAPLFSQSGFPKFQALGPAILQKVPLEQNLVYAYSQWGAAASQQILPLMEYILANELIPQYQRAVVQSFPDIAQQAAMEVAVYNGDPDFGRGTMLGALWRTSGQLVGGTNEQADPTLPVVDPENDTSPQQSQYLSTARHQRHDLSHQYLNDWNNQTMYFFDREAKMCQFGSLWRSFTCGYLEHLLNVEYPNTNLLHVIRQDEREIVDANAHLEQYFTFVGVAYWKKLPETFLPAVFKNPINGDSLAFAQARVFVPTRRLVWSWYVPGASSMPIGGMPGDFPDLPGSDTPAAPSGPGHWIVTREGVPTNWNLLNQHWSCQLVPATGPNLPTILQTMPSLPAFANSQLTLPSLGSMTNEDIGRIDTH